MPKSLTIASWPPNQTNRVYWNFLGEKVSEMQKGKDLQVMTLVDELNKSPKEKKQELLNSIKLFTNLPLKFYQQYLEIQASKNPINFPKIMEDKNVTVRSCMLKHSEFTSLNGKLNPNHWENLGWKSQKDYDDWLDSCMLFAFSHCNHYCSAQRIFDADILRNNQDQSELFHFKEYPASEIKTNPRKTNIFSVTGFEFRNFKEKKASTVAEKLPLVKAHSKLIMQHILEAAKETTTTDIVLIPFGLGVFISGHPNQEEISSAIISGLVEALKTYTGLPLTIHCCSYDEFFLQLLEANNPNINLIYTGGKDAYTLANKIQDRGDIDKETTTDPSTRILKSMLINAADHDWSVLLDANKTPGQFFKAHTLYNQTSDEYYALVTDFSFHSVQNLITSFENFPADKLKAYDSTNYLEIEDLVEHFTLEDKLTSNHPLSSAVIQALKNFKNSLKVQSNILPEFLIDCVDLCNEQIAGENQADYNHRVCMRISELAKLTFTHRHSRILSALVDIVFIPLGVFTLGAAFGIKYWITESPTFFLGKDKTLTCEKLDKSLNQVSDGLKL